jgi:acyl-coenzyme A synthetase/AMP-(fatty) acid ligase/acyl carrier protein
VKFSLKPDLIMGATTHYTFDISVLELLGTLLTGVKVVLMDKAEPDDILEQINSYKITALQITPSRLGQLFNANENSIAILKKLKVLLVGGETLRHHDYDRLKELKATKVYNVYGPTETTIWSTCLDIQASTSLSIGKPLCNEGVYILNSEGALSPIGIPGEICIGGDGLARGYLNNPERTAEKFVADPFVAGEKIYKTGDLGRWLSDGNIEFMGRKDDQLKIQGYRIEPGEIESTLQQYPTIEEAVVVAQLDKEGEKEMIAYLVCKETLNTVAVREHLRKTLPVYMIPTHYVQVEAIPLLPSGKADKAKLQEMAGLALALGTEYVAPRNEIEEKIAAMWHDVLGKEKIGIKDDFFSLGGHSLKATKLIGMMLKEFGVTMSLLNFFTYATVEGIAGEIEKTKWAANELFDIDNAEKVSI